MGITVDKINEYLESGNDCDSMLNDMGSFDELLGDKTPSEMYYILTDEFNLNADYFYFNGLGRVVSVYEYELEDYARSCGMELDDE